MQAGREADLVGQGEMLLAGLNQGVHSGSREELVILVHF